LLAQRRDVTVKKLALARAFGPLRGLVGCDDVVARRGVDRGNGAQLA